MPDRLYRATVTVTLPDTMDHGPLTVLAQLVLAALDEAEVKTTHALFEEVRDA